MAYTDDNPSTRLAAVRQAISEALTAQSYTVRGRGKVSANLKDLRAMERELMQEVKESSDGSSMASLGRMIPPR